MVFERFLLFVLRVLYFLDKKKIRKKTFQETFDPVLILFTLISYHEILIFLIRVNDHSFQFAKIRNHP